MEVEHGSADWLVLISYDQDSANLCTGCFDDQDERGNQQAHGGQRPAWGCADVERGAFAG
jgi:hypothetical protein